jgi:hypothetical protein
MNNKITHTGCLFLLAGVLLFSGCGKKAADTGSPDYPITISVFSMAAMQQPPADNKIYKWIEQNLHVTFAWDILVGEKDQKIGVMIAGGDYPDLLHVDSQKFYEAGALIPLDDLIEQYGPRLKKTLRRRLGKNEGRRRSCLCAAGLGRNGRARSQRMVRRFGAVGAERSIEGIWLSEDHHHGRIF